VLCDLYESLRFSYEDASNSFSFKKGQNLSAFDTVEILAEFSKAIRHGLISLECLRELEGVDPAKVKALTNSVRRVHSEATDYLVSVIGASADSDSIG
jgi:hypothetical protein